ncbi:hypothetical protein LINPERPRIM_LOCUS3770 [Linum perenne]
MSTLAMLEVPSVTAEQLSQLIRAIKKCSNSIAV